MQVAARKLRIIGISLLSREAEKYREHSIALAAVVSLLYAPSVWATETVWDVLESFGLRGTWAISCDQPATPQNFHTIYVKGTDGLAAREIDSGAGFPIRHSIVESVQLISPSKLKIRVRNSDPNWGKMNDAIHEAVMIKESDPKTNEIFRIRFIESVLSDGTVIVKGGILKSLGKPSFWNYKCRSSMS